MYFVNVFRTYKVIDIFEHIWVKQVSEEKLIIFFKKVQFLLSLNLIYISIHQISFRKNQGIVDDLAIA